MNRTDLDDLGITFVNERNAPRPEEEQTMEVHSWRLLKAPSGDLHLGTLRDPQGDRVVVRLTSVLGEFDMTARAVTTVSGRRYVLMGPPKTRPLERQAIRNGAAHLGLAAGIDVSEPFWEKMSAAE